MLGQKSTPGKFNKIEVISNIFSSHNAMRLEINCKKTVKKKQQQNTKYMETKQYVTKQPMDHWRNQGGNKKLPTWKATILQF